MKPKLRFVTAVRQRRMNFLPRKFCLEKLAGLFRLPGLLIIFLLWFSASAIAQETPPTPDKFYVGTEFQNQTVEDTRFYDPFYESGMNFITQRADIISTWPYVQNYDMLAVNVRAKEEYIQHYTTCYYSKWEAEVDAEADRVGFKHRDSLGYLIGDSATWKNKLCWSSLGLSEPRDSLMYGPHYRQDKRYKRILYDHLKKDSVHYVPRFNMALDNHGDADPDEDVCRIKVVFRYRIEGTGHHNYTFPIERTLKVGDFDTSGAFDDFYLHPDPRFASYMYPPEFWLPKNIDIFADAPLPIQYIDWESFTGIQYCVDWLGDDDLFTLYINYVEIYDKDGWSEYIETPGLVTTRIQNYAASFDTTFWQNIKFWAGVDEPYSIDCYEPIRVVDSLIRTVNSTAPLIVPFNPTWWHTLNVNGEDEVLQFYNRANPQKITLSINPCAEWWTAIRFDDFEWMRFNFQ